MNAGGAFPTFPPYPFGEGERKPDDPPGMSRFQPRALESMVVEKLGDWGFVLRYDGLIPPQPGTLVHRSLIDGRDAWLMVDVSYLVEPKLFRLVPSQVIGEASPPVVLTHEPPVL